MWRADCCQYSVAFRYMPGKGGIMSMTRRMRRSGITRRSVISNVAAFPLLSTPIFRTSGWAQSADPLPSWNNGAAKQAIIGFVQATTDMSSPNFVSQEARIATFDQDGTLWVEHPMYTQVMYCLERVPTLVKQKPQLRERQPFKTILSGDREAIAKLSL